MRKMGSIQDVEEAVKVSRLVLSGNSLAQPDLTNVDDTKKVLSAFLPARSQLTISAEQKRYGYDSSLYSSKPTDALDQFLSQLCPSLPVDLMPGEKDPTAPTMPQQALHPAMLPNAAVWENFNGRSNPWSFEINGTSYAFLPFHLLERN